MPIFTEEQFRRLAYEFSGNRGLTGAVNESRAYSKSASATSVFLSHCHSDKDKVEQAKYIFENLGVTIYVDWMDSTMPEKTNGYTASKIKEKIVENKKFVLLATNSAISSKWCNWEVGIGDTHKHQYNNIAILGLADNRVHWNGNEYLQIYPSIELETGNNRNTRGEVISPGYYVFYPAKANGERSYVSLKKWLLL